MSGQSGFEFVGTLANPGPFAYFDNGTQSAAIGIDSTGRLVISSSSSEGASSSDAGQFVIDTAGNITFTPTTTVTISSGNLILTDGMVETNEGLVLIGAISGEITLEAPSTVTTYSLILPDDQGLANQVLAQSGTPGILTWADAAGGTVTSVTATSPVFSSGGATPNITIQQSTTSQSGYLTSNDWNAFNDKVSDGGNSYGSAMSIGTNDDYDLSFITQGVTALTIDTSGNIILDVGGTLSLTAGLVFEGSSSGSVTVAAPSTVTTYDLTLPDAQGSAGQVLTQSSTPGILTWTSPTSGTVTSVTATSPVASSGGSTPNITIQTASGSQEGALTSSDWTTFNNKVSDGGNSYGAAMSVGTSDNNMLSFLTDGTDRVTIDTSGNLSMLGSGTIATMGGIILEGSSSGSVTMLAPATISSPYDLTMPDAQGTSGQVLTQTSTAGVLTWTTPTTGTVTSVTASSPISSSGGSTPNITIQNASGSQEGALLSADWTTFNNKVAQGGNSYGTTMSIGTNDSNPLDFRTDGNNVVTIDTSGNLTVLGSGTIGTTGGLVLSGSSSGSVTLQSATTVGTPYTLTMPNAQGSANQALAYSGITGDLTWTSFLLLSGGTLSGSLTLSGGGNLILNGYPGGGSLTLSAASPTTSYALIMPAAQGTSGQVLTQSATPGTLSWATPTTGTVTSVTGTSPIASSGGSTPAISIQNATTSQTGALTSTDWNTFNNKVSDGGNSYGALMTVGTNDSNNLEFLTNGVNRLTIDTSGNLTIGTSQGAIIFPSTSGTVTMKAAASSFSYTIQLPATSGSSGQCLTQSSTATVLNWQSFLPLSGGTITGSLTITNGGDLQLQGTSSLGYFQMLASPTTASYSITMPPSQGSVGQVLTQSATTGVLQWSTPTSGTVTSVTGTSPIASSGGSTPAISIQNATTSQTGALTSTDWNTFNNKLSNGGNSYGAPVEVGSNDSQSFDIRTNNTNQISVDTAGNTNIINGNLTVSTGNMFIANTGSYIQIDNGVIFLDNQSELAFYGTSGANINLKAPTNVPSSYSIFLPTAQGSANQALAQNGSGGGNLTWTSFLPLTGGTITGGVTFSAANLTFSGGGGITVGSSGSLTMTGGIIYVTSGGAISFNGSTSGAVSVSAPATITNYSLVLPNAQGTAGQVLAQSSTPGDLQWTTATNANTASAIVQRDASGNFSAGTITASLTGHSSLDLPLTGGTLSGNLTISSGGLTVTGNTSTTGTLTAGAASGTTGTLILNGSTSGSVTIESPAAPTSYALIMPTAQGAANQHLAQSSTPGTLTWATPLTVDTLAFANASQGAQSIATTSPGTQIVFNSVSSPGYHLNPPNSTYSTSTGSFTPAATGYYLVSMNVQISTTTATRTVLATLYNSTTSTVMCGSQITLNSTGGLTPLAFSMVINLSSSDTYGIYLQASGTGVTVVAGVAYPFNYVNFTRVA